MLEWEVASGEQTQLEIIAALQGTDLGQKYYKDLCERQNNLQRLVSSKSELIIFRVLCLGCHKIIPKESLLWLPSPSIKILF